MKKRMGMLVFVLIVCAALGLTLLACDSSEQSGYSVAFEANGGSAVEGLSGVTEVAEAPSSVRTGYTLEGWYLAPDLSGEAVTFPLTVTADTTLYAKWSANTYTVSFDYTTADGGIGESSIEGTYGSALGALPAPTMTGYTFAGWYDGDTLYTADSLMPAGDLELSAVFAANTYTLTFDTTVEGLTVEDVSVTFAAAVPALPVPEREGYTFLGWWDADGDKFEAGAPYNTVGDTALTARWEQITFTVTAVVGYDGGEDKIVPDVAYGTTIGEVLETIGYVSRPGYKQPDWYLDAEFANEVDEDAKLTAETSIYAKWEAMTYYLTFSKWELQEGSPVLFESAGENYDFTVTVTYGQPIGDLPGVEEGVYVPAGFTFTGWGTANPSITGERNNPVEEDTVWTWTDNNQINLKPGYERITYTLTLDAGEGAFEEGGSTVTVPAEYYTSLSTLLAGYTPEQDGKTFGGWAYDGETVETEGFYTWTQDITLTAVWYGLPQTLTLDPAGGTMQGETELTVNGSAEIGALPVPAKEGYTFAGWWADEVEYIETSLMPESALTLTAKWTANTYTISFSSEGGGDFEAIEVAFGSVIPELPTPDKAGSVFTGWLLGSEQVKQGDTYIWAYDITLVAGYEGEVAYTEGINYVFVPEADGIPAHFKVGADGFAQDYTGDAYEGDNLTEVILRSEVKHTDGQTYPVTEIGTFAFYMKASLQHITIPDSVTFIGDSAFQNSGLVELTIPSSVKEIGGMGMIFLGCGQLKKVVYEEGSPITSFDCTYALNSVKSLEELTLPANLTTLVLDNVNSVFTSPLLAHIYIPAAEGQKYVSNAEGTQITDTTTDTVIWTSPIF